MSKLIPVIMDYESYWSATHSLTKMPAMEYVLHPDTEIISLAVKVGDYPTDVIFGEAEIKSALSCIDWSDKFVIAHNNEGFDSMISAWRFGIKPALWGCTMAMARPHHAKHPGLSLAKLVEYYGLGVKDNRALVATRGRHLRDFTVRERADMEEYNRADTEQCAGLFKILAKKTPADEMRLIDKTIRMLVEPQFELDVPLLRKTLVEVKEEKLENLKKVVRAFAADNPAWQELRAAGWADENISGITSSEPPEEMVRALLASSQKFAAFLQEHGVEPPMKTSPATGKPTFALAKTDQEFLDLQEHPNELVAAAARARLGVKSTLLETRIEAFINTSLAVGGKLPIPLKYCGADTTGRWSGWAYNPQNLPQVPRDKDGNIVYKPSNALRLSLRAPKKHKVVVADLSGIELRVNHFLWKVQSSMALFTANPAKADLYKDFASTMYDVAEDEVTKAQRQMGKVCVAEGTLVLTDRGEVPIEQVLSSDRVWDGVEWVGTSGPIYNGERDVIEYDGVVATPDHEVWVEDGRKVQIGDAAAQSLRLARTGDGRTPLGFSGVVVEGDSAEERVQGSTSPLHGVRLNEVCELRQPTARKDTRVPVVSPEVRSAEVALATDGVSATAVHKPERYRVQELRDARGSVQISVSESGRGLGDGELGFAERTGNRQDQHERALRTGEPTLCDTQSERRHTEAGALSTLSYVSAETPGSAVCGQYVAASDLPRSDGQPDSGTVAHPVMQTKRRVWDLLNCGPRHRFTANGRLVSNCHLGLGFGAGHATFRKVAKLMAGITLDDTEALNIVQTWRAAYTEIAQGWKTCHRALDFIYGEEDFDIDPWGLCKVRGGRIVTPKGFIHYPSLRKEMNAEGRPEWFYGEGRHKARIYAGKVTENLVQHLARHVLSDNLLKVAKTKLLRGYPPAHTVHDELVYVVPEGMADEALDTIQTIMRTPPDWWPELVTWSEGDVADSYGAAK